MYIYIYIERERDAYINTYVHMYAYMYMYIYVYLCMYVCMYVYIYIYIIHARRAQPRQAQRQLQPGQPGIGGPLVIVSIIGVIIGLLRYG